MSFLVPFIFSWLVLIAVLALFYPLVRGVRDPLQFFSRGGRRGADLDIQRRVLLENLRDLQIEREKGKLSEADFNRFAGPLATELDTVERRLAAASQGGAKVTVRRNRLGWVCPECGNLNHAHEDEDLTGAVCVQCGIAI